MTGTNAHHPDLGIWVTGFKPIASCYFTGIDFKGSSFKVDRHYLSMISCFDLRSNSWFIEGIAALGELFFAISGLPDCHDFAFTRTSPLHFSCVAGEMIGADGV
jgi:hypothetical protein